MAFEVFTAYGAAARGEATLRASGYLFLSRALMGRIHAEESEHLVLLYDAETNRLGVRPANGSDSAEIQRAASREPSGTAVNIVPVLRCYDMKQPKRKVRLDAKVEKEILVIDLTPIRDAEPPK